MLNKFTIIGFIAGGIISSIGLISLVDSLANPNETMNFDDIFEIGESTNFPFFAPENSSQTLVITGNSFDVKISTPDNTNKFDDSYEDKANLSWINQKSGENTVKIQNTGNSELNIKGTFEKERDPLFFTYHLLVIIAGVVIIGFSAGFSAKKPKGF